MQIIGKFHNDGSTEYRAKDGRRALLMAGMLGWHTSIEEKPSGSALLGLYSTRKDAIERIEYLLS